MTSKALIVDAARTPMGRGKPGGALAEVHPVDLLAQTLRALLDRHPALDPGEVDDVIVGCVSQTGEQSATPGRMAWLGAGLPVHVPSTTIDRKCGSSQQAVHFAAQGIMAGCYDIVIAAGVESMSRVPMGSARAGADPFGPMVTERFAPGLIAQGLSAELVAKRCSSHNKRVLALGGAKNHLIALPDCDVGMASRDIVASFAGCAGQRCMAASALLLVDEDDDSKTLDTLLDQVVAVSSKIQPGQAAGQVGPLIDKIAQERVLGYINEAEAKGAKILLDGRTERRDGFLILLALELLKALENQILRKQDRKKEKR